MVEATSEALLLEAVETAADSASPFTGPGNLPGKGAPGDKKPQRLPSYAEAPAWQGWRMSQNSLVRAALNNRWLEEQGVPNMRTIWIALHYPEQRSVQGV